mmetsp:Transcript_1009/g.4316  ORF Transcript_1009/g.4316 Transcript_1009/m.4316 type:complete len:246 (-) Transcript_1009:20-757(-)
MLCEIEKRVDSLHFVPDIPQLFTLSLQFRVCLFGDRVRIGQGIEDAPTSGVRFVLDIRGVREHLVVGLPASELVILTPAPCCPLGQETGLLRVLLESLEGRLLLLERDVEVVDLAVPHGFVTAGQQSRLRLQLSPFARQSIQKRIQLPRLLNAHGALPLRSFHRGDEALDVRLIVLGGELDGGRHASLHSKVLGPKTDHHSKTLRSSALFQVSNASRTQSASGWTGNHEQRLTAMTRAAFAPDLF